MRILLVALVGFLVISPIGFLHVAAADDKAIQGRDPARTEKLIQHSLYLLQQPYGRRGFGFENEQNTKELLNKLRGLGFESADELAKVKIGQGFPLYVVLLDKLRQYNKQDGDPWSLLVKTDASIYPLIVQQGTDLDVRSSATVSFQVEEDKTKIPYVAEIGNPQLIRLLTEARKELQKEGHCRLPSECFAVSIPALSLHLFGYRDATTKEFKIVTLNHVRGHVKKEDFRTATEMLEDLSNQAKMQKENQSGHRPKENKELASPPYNPRDNPIIR